MQAVRSTGEAVARYRYEGVKPATVQLRPLGDSLRPRAELLLTVVGQPYFTDLKLVHIRGQWYSTITDTALNASGSVAVNPYPVMGTVAVNENPGSWFYRNIWSPLGSAISNPRMFLFGVLDGLSFGALSWATDKVGITDSSKWSDDEKAAFGVGSVVGMIGSAVLTGGGALAAGAARLAGGAGWLVGAGRAVQGGVGVLRSAKWAHQAQGAYRTASMADGLITAGKGVYEAARSEKGFGWEHALMIGGGLLGARMDVGDIAKASQLGRFGRILGHGGEYAAKPALAVLKPVGKVAKALKTGAWYPTNWVLKQAVHGGLAKVHKGTHDRVSDFLNRQGFQVCFVAGTPILGVLGSKAIEEYKDYETYGDACDTLISRDEFNDDGVLTIRRVLRKFERIGPVLDVVINGQRIGTTHEHPFFVKGQGWTKAQELRIGDQVRLMQPGWATVEKVEDTGRLATVYNLEIEDDHTYFVGCDEWGWAVWAHNAGCTPELVEEALVAAGLKPLEGRAPGKVVRLVNAATDAQNPNSAAWGELRTYLQGKYKGKTAEVEAAIDHLYKSTDPMMIIAQGYGIAAEAAFSQFRTATPAVLKEAALALIDAAQSQGKAFVPLVGGGRAGKVYLMSAERLIDQREYIGRTGREVGTGRKGKDRMMDDDHLAKTVDGKPPAAQLLAHKLTDGQEFGLEGILVAHLKGRIGNSIPALDLTKRTNQTRVSEGAQLLLAWYSKHRGG